MVPLRRRVFAANGRRGYAAGAPHKDLSPMALNVAIQMDPIESVNIDADSTFVLALEAQRRGHRLHHYLPQDMSLRHGKGFAYVRPLEVRRERGSHITLGAHAATQLTGLDVVLMRQDPPLDIETSNANICLQH